MTQILPYPWESADILLLKEAFHHGASIAFPTETFYALGGNALHESLVQRVFEIKQRPFEKALLLLVDDAWLAPVVPTLPPFTQKLMSEFWPGPLTVIIPVPPNLPDFLHSVHQTIAIRYSNSPVVQALLEVGNCPLIGTSANLSGKPPCHQASAVLEQLGSQVDIVVDGGTSPGEQPSTIINSTTTPFEIVRYGAVPEKQLANYLK